MQCMSKAHTKRPVMCLGAMCAQWSSVKVCIRTALHSCLPHSCVTTVMRVCIPSIVPPALFRCSVMPWVWRGRCRSCRKRTRGWCWRGRRTTWGDWLREMGRLRSYTNVWRERPRHWHSWWYVPTHICTRFVCACMCASNHMLAHTCTCVHTIVHIYVIHTILQIFQSSLCMYVCVYVCAYLRMYAEWTCESSVWELVSKWKAH